MTAAYKQHEPSPASALADFPSVMKEPLPSLFSRAPASAAVI
jgi:hypothetical protein